MQQADGFKLSLRSRFFRVFVTLCTARRNLLNFVGKIFGAAGGRGEGGGREGGKKIFERDSASSAQMKINGSSRRNIKSRKLFSLSVSYLKKPNLFKSETSDSTRRKVTRRALLFTTESLKSICLV